MGSNYLVRITGICANIATKLMVDAPFEDNSNMQSRSKARDSKKALNYSKTFTSSPPTKLAFGNVQAASPTCDSPQAGFNDPVDIFKFAMFMRDLDTLRLSMMAAASGDRASETRTELAGAATRSDARGGKSGIGQEQVPVSIAEAIASAVLMLPHARANVQRVR